MAEEAEAGHFCRHAMRMASEDPLWARAREDLVVVYDQDREDVFLWEHAVRVARAVGQIAQGPELREAALDHHALTAAALYHDTGWIVQFRDGTVSHADILANPTSDLQRDLGVSLMEKRLADLLPARVLRRAAECIRGLQQRDKALPETRILSDADNLDQIGTLFLWRLVRRYVAEGKGVQAALDTWRCRQQYGYWQARLDKFCFESVRELARKRFSALADFMAALDREHDGEDLPPGPSIGGGLVVRRT